MLKHTRNLVPEKIVWLQDDVLHSRFYWLKRDLSTAKTGDQIVVSRNGNRFIIDRAPAGKLTLLLRDDMANLDEEIVVVQGESELWRGKSSSYDQEYWRRPSPTVVTPPPPSLLKLKFKLPSNS